MRIPFFTNWLSRRAQRDMALGTLMHSNMHLHEDLDALKGQVGELVKLNRRRELLVIAAQALADKFDDAHLAFGLANHLSDSELAPLLDLFHAAGRPEAADLWESSHSGDDDDPDPFASEDQEPDYACPHGCGFEATDTRYVDAHLNEQHANEPAHA